jgi:hypothetical protein
MIITVTSTSREVNDSVCGGEYLLLLYTSRVFQFNNIKTQDINIFGSEE